MAAILHPTPELVPTYGVPDRPRRPELRLIPGGRAAPDRRAVYRRRRLVVALVSLLVVVVVLAIGRGALGSAVPAPAPASSPAAGAGIVVVQSGDTLWSIARRLRPEGDVRGLVDRLAAIHGPGPLQVGERLPVG